MKVSCRLFIVSFYCVVVVVGANVAVGSETRLV